MQTIKFNSKTYDALVVANLSGRELVDLHNLVVDNLADTDKAPAKVNKFSNRETGARRAWAILQTYDEVVAAEEGQDPTTKPVSYTHLTLPTKA